jgi:ankyrin repeat protein
MINYERILKAAEGHETLVKLLQTIGTDVNARDFQDNTALTEASGCGCTETVRLLPAAGADVNALSMSHSTLLYAIGNDSRTVHIGVIELLLAADADIEPKLKRGMYVPRIYERSSKVLDMLKAHVRRLEAKGQK